jgi:hypothetical protein
MFKDTAPLHQFTDITHVLLKVFQLSSNHSQAVYVVSTSAGCNSNFHPTAKNANWSTAFAVNAVDVECGLTIFVPNVI